MITNKRLFEVEERIRISVRVYLYVFDDLAEYSNDLVKDELSTLFMRVNKIWRPAGIYWYLQSIQTRSVDYPESLNLKNCSSKKQLRNTLEGLSPDVPEVIAKRLWRVCLVRQLPLKTWGVYLPRKQTVFCAGRTPRGQLNSAVLAHELGHSLGLRHVNEKFNLMNPSSLKEIHSIYDGGEYIHEQHHDIFSQDQVASVRLQVEQGPYYSSSP